MRRIYTLDEVKEKSSQKLFNVISFFAGAGGSSTGYRLAGGSVLAINEFIPEAQRVYERNYPDTLIFRDDIRKTTGLQVLNKLGLAVGQLDILDGSPPCSAFSIAGKREKGWGEEKSYSDSKQVVDDLFYEYARMIKEIQPRVFVAENVKGLTVGAASHMLGESTLSMFAPAEEQKATILDTLKDCGYQVEYKVLNAAHYLVPQSRERIIFIGVRNDLHKSAITFPKDMRIRVTVKEALEGLVPDIYKPLSPSVDTIFNHMMPGEPTMQCAARLGLKMGGTQRSKVYVDRPSRTITTTPEVFHWEERRTLAINELKRISGLPEDYYVGEDLSFSRAWERIGRMNVPFLVEAVAKHIYENILK